jgi:putative acetyltransferase
MILIKRTNGDDPDLKKLIVKLDKDLFAMYQEDQAIYDTFNKIDHLQTVLIAYDNETAIGCGCFKKFNDDSVEIKRMYVDDNYRNKGIASSILNELENWAKELNYSSAVLETGYEQKAAVHLYQRSGYIVIPSYGQYINMPKSVCMKKQLP